MQGIVRWNKFTWKSVLFLGAIAIGILFFMLEKNRRQRALNSIQSVNQMNNRRSVMVDSITRFDSAVEIGNSVFKLCYTIVNAEKSTFDTTVFKQDVKPKIIDFFKNNPSYQIFEDDNTNLMLAYFDKDGYYLSSFMIYPTDYYDNNTRTSGMSNYDLLFMFIVGLFLTISPYRFNFFQTTFTEKRKLLIRNTGVVFIILSIIFFIVNTFIKK